jgi:protein-disulfide isomerase
MESRRQEIRETLLIATAILCLGLTTALWLHVRNQLGEIRETQREMATDMASLRGASTIDITGAPSQGRPDAAVTLVEFSDYECPFCIRHFSQTMPQLRANYIENGKILYVFKDLPIDQLHPAAIGAHQAARCAAEQDKFWALHQRLFSAPGTHGADAIDARAQEAGLDLASFKACIASGRTTASVRESVALAQSLGASGTPSFFIGLRKKGTNEVQVLKTISGAHPYEEFEKAIASVAAIAG